jgi:hypothetical protein
MIPTRSQARSRGHGHHVTWHCACSRRAVWWSQLLRRVWCWRRCRRGRSRGAAWVSQVPSLRRVWCRGRGHAASPAARAVSLGLPHPMRHFAVPPTTAPTTSPCPLQLHASRLSHRVWCCRRCCRTVRCRGRGCHAACGTIAVVVPCGVVVVVVRAW